MKKILFLLFSVLLLFPVAIYIGNLAEIPASKKVIVYLRDLVGMSTTKTTTDSSKTDVLKIPAPYNHVGLVESWRNLGTGNFADLLQIMSAPGKHDAWQASMGEFMMGDPLHSAAFFSSSWSFWQANQEKLSLIAYYQPWIDVLLLIQIAEVNGSYKAVAIGIKEPGSTITATTPTTMAEALTQRLQRAEQAFQDVTKNPDTIDGMLNSSVIKKSKNKLDQYVSLLRNNLASTSTENPSLAILAWLDEARAGQVEEVQELIPVPNEWLKQLQPVLLLKIDSDHWLLAASDSTQAERVLLVELQITEHKALATEIQFWDAATVGDPQ